MQEKTSDDKDKGVKKDHPAQYQQNAEKKTPAMMPRVNPPRGRVMKRKSEFCMNMQKSTVFEQLTAPERHRSRKKVFNPRRVASVEAYCRFVI